MQHRRGVRYYFDLYGVYLRLYFRTLVAYRADTLVAFFGGLLTQVSALLFLSSIFRHIPRLAGWDYYELLFIFSVSLTAGALSIVFLNAPFSIHGYIRRGTLDLMLIRPAGTLFQIVAMSQEINGIGSVATGLAMMGYAMAHLPLEWSAGSVVYLALALLSGMVVKFAVLLFFTVLAFWVFEMRSVLYPVTWLFDFTQYPLGVFHPFMRGLLTYVLPFSLGTYYPAVYLLRPELHGAALFAPLAGLLVAAVAYGFWRIGLRHYESASG
ncbi:MAG: ABC-2 family transporter protein [Paenibacillaceae bacterium]|nr:ABC-2 family transporter protein [Paenibacillaceae bacterium]